MLIFSSSKIINDKGNGVVKLSLDFDSQGQYDLEHCSHSLPKNSGIDVTNRDLYVWAYILGDCPADLLNNPDYHGDDLLNSFGLESEISIDTLDCKGLKKAEEDFGVVTKFIKLHPSFAAYLSLKWAVIDLKDRANKVGGSPDEIMNSSSSTLILRKPVESDIFSATSLWKSPQIVMKTSSGDEMVLSVDGFTPSPLHKGAEAKSTASILGTIRDIKQNHQNELEYLKSRISDIENRTRAEVLNRIVNLVSKLIAGGWTINAQGQAEYNHRIEATKLLISKSRLVPEGVESNIKKDDYIIVDIPEPYKGKFYIDSMKMDFMKARQLGNVAMRGYHPHILGSKDSYGSSCIGDLNGRPIEQFNELITSFGTINFHSMHGGNPSRMAQEMVDYIRVNIKKDLREKKKEEKGESYTGEERLKFDPDSVGGGVFHADGSFGTQ